MLPTKVEELEKAADELHAKLYGNPEKPNEAPAPENKPDEKPEPKAEEKPAEPPSDEPIKPLKAKDPEKENDPLYWKRRAEIMAGKYESELPRYAEENRALKAKLAELAATAVAPQPEPPAAPTPPEDLVEKYGEEFVKDMAKLMPGIGMPATSDELHQMKAELAELKDKAEKYGFQEFKKQLAEKAPEWSELNTDEGFNTWLDEFDQASGRPRRELFNQAVTVNDVTRTAYFFNTYGQQNQSWAGKPSPEVPPAEHYMAPSHSKANQAPPGKKLWSAAEVSAFYDDVRKGRVSDDVATRIEQDIFAAQREGRFRG